MTDIEDPRDPEALVEQVAAALGRYNTTHALYFVVHDGGYEGIARAAIASLELYPTSVDYRDGVPFQVQYSTPHLRVTT